MTSQIDLKKLGYRERKKEKYQVRFWSENKELYLNFIRIVQDNGRRTQDVFNDFMKTYSELVKK